MCRDSGKRTAKTVICCKYSYSVYLNLVLLLFYFCYHIFDGIKLRAGINGENASMVWPTNGSRTAKEHNRTKLRARSGN